MRLLNPSHQQEVREIIETVVDIDTKKELKIINNQFQKVLVGLANAYRNLLEIDETCGTEHCETINEIKQLYHQVKESELILLEMSAVYSNDCYCGEYPNEVSAEETK